MTSMRLNICVTLIIASKVFVIVTVDIKTKTKRIQKCQKQENNFRNCPSVVKQFVHCKLSLLSKWFVYRGCSFCTADVNCVYQISF